MKRPARIEEVLGVACMVVLVLLTLGNVLTRYLTDASFAWTEEISIFLIVVMTLAGRFIDRVSLQASPPRRTDRGTHRPAKMVTIVTDGERRVYPQRRPCGPCLSRRRA